MDLTLVLFSFALSTVFLILFSEISSWIRRKLPRKVQCWFCHFKCTVNYKDANSWICPDCDQYNGFDKDGGYNRIIPSQHDERLNVSVTSIGRKKKNWRKKEPSLCTYCNYNQELKVKQLASFTPINERKYDQEVEHYRAQLEDSYRLCRKCEETVAQVTSKQRPIFNGPRRLINASKKLIFRSSLTIYLTLLLSVFLALSLSPAITCSVGLLPYQLFTASRPLTAVGLILNTILFIHFRSLWAFFDWSIWVAMAAMPHLLQNQDTGIVTSVQVAINVCLFFYNLIILVRRKKYEHLFNAKEKKRQERKKKEEMSASWTPLAYPDVQRKGPDVNKKEDVRLSRRSLLKPIPRKSEELDLSRLSLGSVQAPSRRDENPFNRPFWDPPTGITRSSSYSSGISLTPPESPSWSTRNNWANSTVAAPPAPSSLPPPDSSPKENRSSWGSPFPREHHHPSASWQSAKEPTGRSSALAQWTPPGWTSVEQPYQCYPVAYYYSHQYQKPPASVSSYLASSLPTLILAATNAALVYIIYTKELKT